MTTLDEFRRLPHADGRTELVRGRVVREPPAGFAHGDLGSGLLTRLRIYARHRGLGTVVGPDTGFVLSEEPPTVRSPDVAFVRAEKLRGGRPEGYAPFAPDLAVEVVSPSNTVVEVQERVLDYLDAGTAVVWVVEPAHRRITEYRSRSDIRILGPDDQLEGGAVLPDFAIPVSEVFEV